MPKPKVQNLKINLLELLVHLDVFHFIHTKILGAYGDGGFILTNSFKLLFFNIKKIRFYGIDTVDKKNKFYNKYYSILMV